MGRGAARVRGFCGLGRGMGKELTLATVGNGALTGNCKAVDKGTVENTVFSLESLLLLTEAQVSNSETTFCVGMGLNK